MELEKMNMKVLHVSLGLPPFRTGGLNRYCLDLMREQKKQGETVELLYPGEFRFGGSLEIVKTKNKEFDVFRIINPLPLALTNGINDPDRYMIPCPKPEVFKRFLLKDKPDVIHVHSFQGIHKEFFQIADELGIQLVFTTHDCYPFCPACVMLQRDATICSGPDGAKCEWCNNGRGLSPMKEYVMQSRIYERLKYSWLLKKIRSNQVKAMECTQLEESCFADQLVSEKSSRYNDLNRYYLSILKYMGKIHANSSLAKSIYKRYHPNGNYCQFDITHAGIVHKKHTKKSERRRFGYVGGINRYKGLPLLLRALDLLKKANIENYELWLYGADYTEYASKNSRLHNGGVYNSETENMVWESFDTLIVPSQCYETFGFVVLEAIAHGVSVICSDLVGAKQFLKENDVFKHDSAEELAAAMMRDHDVPNVTDTQFSIEEHARQVKSILYEKNEDIDKLCQ